MCCRLCRLEKKHYITILLTNMELLIVMASNCGSDDFLWRTICVSGPVPSDALAVCVCAFGICETVGVSQFLF